MSTLAFFAADTMGVTLRQKQGHLSADETHTIGLGPWKMDLPVAMDLDLSGRAELGFWVTLNMTVRAYLVVREKENWLFLLGTKALLGCEKTGFTGRTVNERLLEIKPATVAVFHWGGKDWEQRV